jgi:hypothetical protein
MKMLRRKVRESPGGRANSIYASKKPRKAKTDLALQPPQQPKHPEYL